jgi:hypothetical protein
MILQEFKCVGPGQRVHLFDVVCGQGTLQFMAFCSVIFHWRRFHGNLRASPARVHNRQSIVLYQSVARAWPKIEIDMQLASNKSRPM